LERRSKPRLNRAWTGSNTSGAAPQPQRNGGQLAEVLTQVQAGVIEVALEIETEAAGLEALLRRYQDTPMSLADACLVRLAELHADCQVFTLDADFRRYRRHGRQVIPLLAPE
jgi:predicted nucleic acid-binding protein